MKKYYAVSDSGKVRNRFEIIDTKTGEFVLVLKEIISGKRANSNHSYNKAVVLSVEDIDGKATIKKIGIIKTLNFDIADYDKETSRIYLHTSSSLMKIKKSLEA